MTVTSAVCLLLTAGPSLQIRGMKRSISRRRFRTRLPATACFLLLAATASGADGDAYVHIRLVVNAHGVTSGWIICEVPDTGSHTIPAPLVTSLIDLGLSGWPLVEIARRSDASTSIQSGCVELLVYSQISLPVEIPNLVSCSTDDDCPTGQACLEDLTCG